jgi:hypothetical protein
MSKHPRHIFIGKLYEHQTAVSDTQTQTASWAHSCFIYHLISQAHFVTSFQIHQFCKNRPRIVTFSLLLKLIKLLRCDVRPAGASPCCVATMLRDGWPVGRSSMSRSWQGQIPRWQVSSVQDSYLSSLQLVGDLDRSSRAITSSWCAVDVQVHGSSLFTGLASASTRG